MEIGSRQYNKKWSNKKDCTILRLYGENLVQNWHISQNKDIVRDFAHNHFELLCSVNIKNKDKLSNYIYFIQYSDNNVLLTVTMIWASFIMK